MMLTAPGNSFIDMLNDGFNEETNYEDNLFPDLLNIPPTPSISLPEGYLDIPNLKKREHHDPIEDKNNILLNNSPENDKKITEKEKHKVRQRVRRSKINTTLDRLKTMVPQCAERESEINAPGKKKKVDQTQLLELTVDYIQQLKDAMAELQKENQFLRNYIDKNSPNSSPGSYSGSSPPNYGISPNASPNSSNYDHLSSPDLELEFQILANDIQPNPQNIVKQQQQIMSNYFHSHQISSNSPPKSVSLQGNTPITQKTMINQQPIINQSNGTMNNLSNIQNPMLKQSPPRTINNLPFNGPNGNPTAPGNGINPISSNFTNSFPISTIQNRSAATNNPIFTMNHLQNSENNQNLHYSTNVNQNKPINQLDQHQNQPFNHFTFQPGSIGQPMIQQSHQPHPMRLNQPINHLQSTINPVNPSNHQQTGSMGTYLKKRNIHEVYNQSEIDYELNTTKQPKYLNTARVLMAVFVVGLIFYNPISYPQNPGADMMNSVYSGGRTLQGMGENSVFLQSPAVSTNWFFFLFMAASAKICMLIFWTFGALLLDHFFVPPPQCVQMAKKENDLGIKLYDEGDYHAAKRHFSKALQHLGRSPSPNVLQRLFHIPLELCRQILHLLRIGLWCDGYLVHLRGGAPTMLELARSNHYLFSLNMLSNTIDSHSVLYFLVSLNAAESLYQKPPVLAEVYATIAIAFYGLLSMPKAYHHLMNKAWAIVDSCQATGMEDKKKDSVDNTIAYLLLLSSYGTLCSGNLVQVQSQIQAACELFHKEGNINMHLQGQFIMAYTHFLRGNCQSAVQLLTAVDISKLRDDPRISWWRELILIGCKLTLNEPEVLNENNVKLLEDLYTKVESHSTFAPSWAVPQYSVLSLLLLRLGNTQEALNVAITGLNCLSESAFNGWLFYCGFYLSEVLFTIWEEERNRNNPIVNQISRACHKLCNCLRKVARDSELALPITYLTLGRYSLAMREYKRAISYFEKVSAGNLTGIETYTVRANVLIEQANYELESLTKSETDPTCICIV